MKKVILSTLLVLAISFSSFPSWAAISYSLEKTVEQKAAEGDVESQVHLGNVASVNGRVTEAAKWFGMAAERGHPDAQYRIGSFYSDGIGVKQNDTKAVEWLNKAAQQGHTDARQFLSTRYANWRDSDDPDAINRLAVRYANGDGVQRDDRRAVELLRIAAEKGNAEAQNNLGFMYTKGRGVEQSDAKAIEWYSRAAAQGHTGAKQNLYVMSPEGQVAQRKEAEAVAEAYREMGRIMQDLQKTKPDYSPNRKYFWVCANCGGTTVRHELSSPPESNATGRCRGARSGFHSWSFRHVENIN